jgi:hypothetical protein
MRIRIRNPGHPSSFVHLYYLAAISLTCPPFFLFLYFTARSSSLSKRKVPKVNQKKLYNCGGKSSIIGEEIFFVFISEFFTKMRTCRDKIVNLLFDYNKTLYIGVPVPVDRGVEGDRYCINMKLSSKFMVIFNLKGHHHAVTLGKKFRCC